MQSYQIRLPKLHAAQYGVVKAARRFNVLCCGRRWGKSTLGEDRLVHPALTGKPVAWYAPTNKSLLESWERVKDKLRSVAVRSLEQQHSIELVTGGKVEMWSLEDPDSSRGRKYARVIVDEAAFVRDLQYAWQNVIRHTLLDYRGDAWFASTPNGLNYFEELHQQGQNPIFQDWASWQMPTSSNPFISPDEIESLKLELRASQIDQEIYAQFLSSESAVFTNVRGCVSDCAQSEPIPSHQYAFGIDWGRFADATAVAIIDLRFRACVAVEHWQGVPYPEQQERVKALNQKWRPLAIIAESNSMGQPIIEMLSRNGLPILPFTTTNASKAIAVEGLAMAFEQSTIAIPNDDMLVRELQAYRGERLPGGLMRYSAPPGKHDDLVMALAIGWQAVESYAPQPRTVTYYDSRRISPF